MTARPTELGQPRWKYHLAEHPQVCRPLPFRGVLRSARKFFAAFVVLSSLSDTSFSPWSLPKGCCISGSHTFRWSRKGSNSDNHLGADVLGVSHLRVKILRRNDGVTTTDRVVSRSGKFQKPSGMDCYHRPPALLRETITGSDRTLEPGFCLKLARTLVSCFLLLLSHWSVALAAKLLVFSGIPKENLKLPIWCGTVLTVLLLGVLFFGFV